PTDEKSVRAQPFAAQAEAGNVRLLRAGWNKDWLDEIELFPLATGHGLVQKRPFSGNSTDPVQPCRARQVGLDVVTLLACKPRVAQEFQPVGMRLAGQQFRRTFSLPLGTLTAQEPAMVQEEL